MENIHIEVAAENIDEYGEKYAVVSIDLVLPDFHGTEKQVAYANDIRYRILKNSIIFLAEEYISIIKRSAIKRYGSASVENIKRQIDDNIAAIRKLPESEDVKSVSDVVAHAFFKKIKNSDNSMRTGCGEYQNAAKYIEYFVDEFYRDYKWRI